MIQSLMLSFKRTIRSVYFPCLMVILTAALFFAPMLGREEELPTAGVCCFDDSGSARRMTAYLTDNGFELCESEELLRKNIASGSFGCGIIIPHGFEEMMRAQNIDGAVTFISASSTYAKALYIGHASAAIFAEYAPYISAEALKDSGITEEEMVAEYREMLDSGAAFTFDTEYKNAEVSADARPRTYTLGAASLLIFAVMMYTACDILEKDIFTLAPRIGIAKAIKNAVIPIAAVRILLVILASLISGILEALITGDRLILSLVPAVSLYTLIMWAFALLCAALFKSTAKMQIFTFYILILSIVLCPVYIDAALIVPWVEPIRYFVAPYMMWVCADSTLGLIIAPILLILSPIALYLRFSGRGRVILQD